MENTVHPVSLLDIANFLQLISIAWEDPIFLSFVLMITFSIMIGVRRVLVGVKQT